MSYHDHHNGHPGTTITTERRRYVPLRFATGWAIWDCQRQHIADGIYFNKELCCDVARHFNDHPAAGDRVWYSPEDPLLFDGARECYE